jgi:hypothetical protein
MHLTITTIQQHHARLVAQARTKSHDHVRPANAYHATADYFGALAEIVLYDAIERDGGQFEFTLLAEQSPIGADVELQGRSWDVKAILPNKSFLYINKAGYDRCEADYYVPIRFVTERCAIVLAPIPHARVGTWTLRNDTGRPYYSVSADTLPAYRWASLRGLVRPKRKAG